MLTLWDKRVGMGGGAYHIGTLRICWAVVNPALSTLPLNDTAGDKWICAMMKMQETHEQVKAWLEIHPSREDEFRLLILRRIEVIQSTLRKTREMELQVRSCLVEIPGWDTGPNIAKRAVISWLKALLPLGEELLNRERQLWQIQSHL
jgi:hypothetical protein